MEIEKYKDWRKKNFIPIVASNFSRNKFLNENWNEFQGLFFKQGYEILDSNIKEWLKHQSNSIRKWYNKDTNMVKLYYIESKVCESIRNKKYKDSTIYDAENKKCELIKRATEAEIIVKEYLNTKKIPYKFQEIIYITDEFGNIKDYYIVDFLIGNTVLEVDGGYHLKKSQIIKDSIRTNELEKMGYKVVRIKNEEVNNINEVLGTA